MCGGAGPRSLGEFDQWVQRRLLSPASAMFREGGLLLREEPSITDPTSYASVLAAISAGATRRSEIAAALARPSSALAHLLTGLEDIGLIEHLEDALRGKRSVFRMAEPIVRLHQLITSRYEPELVVGRADQVSMTHQKGHQLDIVVTDDPSPVGRISAIGEAKATNEPVGLGQLRRLEHLRGLLPGRRVDQPPKLLLFSRTGFTSSLTGEAAVRPDVELVSIDRLYYGA